MKIQGKKAKVGMKVYDSWWPWQLGRIEKVLKTRIHVRILSENELRIYDKAHLQFLRVV